MALLLNKNMFRKYSLVYLNIKIALCAINLPAQIFQPICQGEQTEISQIQAAKLSVQTISENQ